MKNINLHYFVWILRRYAHDLGVFGLMGFFLLSLAILVGVAKILPMQEEIESLNTQLNQQAAMQAIKKTNLPVPLVIPKASASKQATDFYARFPEVATLSDWLQMIDEAAIAQNLALSHGDYKLNKINKNNTSPSKNSLIRYEILLPVKGSYVQIREFIAVILHDLPMLALSDFQIVRENVSATTVEAKLLFTLFLREPS